MAWVDAGVSLVLRVKGCFKKVGKMRFWHKFNSLLGGGSGREN